MDKPEFCWISFSDKGTVLHACSVRPAEDWRYAYLASCEITQHVIDTLPALLAAYEDAERYRQTRERAEKGPWEMEDGEPAVVVYLKIPDSTPEHWDAPEVFDAAIDAAMGDKP